jgi:hypothetical protein
MPIPFETWETILLHTLSSFFFTYLGVILIGKLFLFEFVPGVAVGLSVTNPLALSAAPRGAEAATNVIILLLPILSNRLF